MARVLKDAVWVDFKEYTKGSSPTGDVAARIGEHLWEDVEAQAPESSAVTVDVDRLVALAQVAFEDADSGLALDAAVRAVLTDLGYDAARKVSLSDPEGQPKVDVEEPSQFVSVPVTEGGAAVEPAEIVEPEPTSEPVEVLTPEVTNDPTPLPVPNRGGAGSSTAHWAAYATSAGVEFEEGAERKDIIAACRAANVPVD